MRLAEVYDLNITELAPSADAQLAVDFAWALKDPALETGSLPRAEIEAVLQSSPRIAAAFVRLHDRYREALVMPQADANPMTDRDKVEALAETSRPVEQVRAWFYRRGNHVDPRWTAPPKRWPRNWRCTATSPMTRSAPGWARMASMSASCLRR